MPPKKDVKQLYNDPTTGLTSLSTFVRNNKLNKKEARDTLMNHEPYTENRYTRTTFPRRKVIVSAIDEVWSGDLMDVSRDANENNGTRFLLILQDVMSKYTWALPLKSKETNEVAKVFANVLRTSGRSPKSLWTDNGGEFLGTPMKRLYEKHNIERYSTTTGNKSVFAERFIRTLRLRLQRLADVRGNHKYIDVLQQIIDLYNKTAHTTTKVPPASFGEQHVEDAKKRMVTGQTPHHGESPFSIGDTVKISLKRGAFGKEATSQRWSKQYFTIADIRFTNPITYLLKRYNGQLLDGGVYAQELQKVREPQGYAFEYVLDKDGERVQERRRDGTYYKVHWIGYPASDDSWVKDTMITKDLTRTKAKGKQKAT